MYRVIKVAENGGSGSDTCEPDEITFGVLSRVVQAVRGYPNGKSQWWLVRFEPVSGHYDPEGPFYSRDEALAARGDRTEFGVFGPFRAPVSRKPLTEALSAAPARKARVLRLDQIPSRVEKVVITLRDGGGSVEFVGEEWDALFWNLPAVEKFVLPYYVTTEGLDKGIQVREDFLNPDAYALVHAPDTDYIVLIKENPIEGGEPEFLPLG